MAKEYPSKNIIYTGFITDQELVALYKSAGAYVFPTFEEGFGIPMLEAFACGTPVVASNIPVLKEIGGDAAMYFNPKDINDMESAIQEILNDQKLRKQILEKGNNRYLKFSWRQLAEQTLDCYRSFPFNVHK